MVKGSAGSISAGSISGPGGRGRARVGVRVGAGVKARARVGHERAWVDDAVEVLVAGEEGVDEHDGCLPLYRFGAGLGLGRVWHAIEANTGSADRIYRSARPVAPTRWLPS
eukprot:scaffold61196_cov63-Phaeocystis_antarctica.AAC.8